MADAVLVEAPAVTDLLAALRAAAPSEGQARAVLDTYLLAQSVGWQQARALRDQRTWYRHLGLLADAGVAVPVRPYRDRRADADQDRHGVLRGHLHKVLKTLANRKVAYRRGRRPSVSARATSPFCKPSRSTLA